MMNPRDGLRLLLGRRPSTHTADEWRRLQAAREVDDSQSGLPAVILAGRLALPRLNHADAEGFERP